MEASTSSSAPSSRQVTPSNGSSLRGGMHKRKFDGADSLPHIPKRPRVGSAVRLEDISDELVLRILSFLTPCELGLAARYETSELPDFFADRPVLHADCAFLRTTMSHGKNDTTHVGCSHESFGYPPSPPARNDMCRDIQPNQPTGLTTDTLSSPLKSRTGNGSTG